MWEKIVNNMITLGRSLHPRRLEISMIHRAEETKKLIPKALIHGKQKFILPTGMEKCRKNFILCLGPSP